MVDNFRAGQLREHVSAWESLTSDSFILDAIKHYHIEFESEVPYQAQEPRHIYSSLSDKEVIDGEISKLLLKGVIERTGHTGNICFCSMLVYSMYCMVVFSPLFSPSIDKLFICKMSLDLPASISL